MFYIESHWIHQNTWKPIVCCLFSGCRINVFRMASSNSSLAAKPCACAYIAFVAGIFSWYADSSHLFRYMDWTTGRSGFDSRQGQRIFPLASVSRPALGPTQPPVQWVPRVLYPGVKRGRCVTLTLTPIYCQGREWVGAIPRLASSATMACRGTPLLCILFKYIESQYLSYLAHDPLSEVICGPQVEKFGDPCSTTLEYVEHNLSPWQQTVPCP
jgi:hypothetical protein